MATTHRKKYSKKRPELNIFKGFHAPYYTQVPDELFDILLPSLGEAELKVLLYICRRTFGFKKGSDRISKSQLENGITKKDGTKLDRGTGLSRRSIRLGVAGLLKKNILIKKRHASTRKGHEATEFALNIINTNPGVHSTQGGGVKRTPGMGTEVPTQDTVRQVKKNVIRNPFKESYERAEVKSGTASSKAKQEMLVSAILEVCGDTKSKAFYRRVARLCPPEMIFRILSEVRELKRHNKIKKTAGATFTAFIKRDAKEQGIDLGLQRK